MARSNHRVGRLRRAIVIMHRGGSSGGGEAKVNLTAYLASTLGGPADLKLAIVDGIVQPPEPKANRAWEYFDYAVGELGSGSDGYGWSGGAAVVGAYKRQAAEERFETYAVGAVSGADLGAGSGWSGTAAIAAY